MQPLIIEAALNESVTRQQNPHVPLSQEQLVAQAVECARAGASLVHFHARDPQTGEQRWRDAGFYAETFAAIRRQTDAILYPGYPTRLDAPVQERFTHLVELAKQRNVRLEVEPIEIGTGLISPYDRGRKTFPDLDAAYVHTYRDTMYTLDLLRDLDIKPLFCIHEAADVRAALCYLDMGLAQAPLFFKYFFWDDLPVGLPPRPSSIQVLESLVEGVPHQWMHQCYGPSWKALERYSIASAGHTRAGLGDNPEPKSEHPPTNRETVERVVALARELGRQVATPADARGLLGLRDQ